MNQDCFSAWFDKFYNSEKAQNFAFSNYNNSTRDEQIGEFSAKAAWEHQQKKIDELTSARPIKTRLYEQALKELAQVKKENELRRNVCEYYARTCPEELLDKDMMKISDEPLIFVNGKRARECETKIKEGL